MPRPAVAKKAPAGFGIHDLTLPPSACRTIVVPRHTRSAHHDTPHGPPQSNSLPANEARQYKRSVRIIFMRDVYHTHEVLKSISVCNLTPPSSSGGSSEKNAIM